MRQMEIALTTAVANSGLAKLQHGSIENLFIVTEPEGAAAWVLAREKGRLKVCPSLRPTSSRVGHTDDLRSVRPS